MVITNKKIQDYYKLKEDVALFDKFVDDYFLSVEQKDKKVYINTDIKLGSFVSSSGEIKFKNKTVINTYVEYAFNELKFDLLSKTLEIMKEDLNNLKNELIVECKEFLENECKSDSKSS